MARTGEVRFAAIAEARATAIARGCLHCVCGRSFASHLRSGPGSCWAISATDDEMLGWWWSQWSFSSTGGSPGPPLAPARGRPIRASAPPWTSRFRSGSSSWAPG